MEDQDSLLTTETERVLEDQIQIIQEQQAQATRVIRVGLTTAGLLLTLLFIAASSGFVNVPSVDKLESIMNSTIVLLVGGALLFFILVIMIRIFYPALAVLSPDAAESSLYGFFTWHPSIDREDQIAKQAVDDEYLDIFEGRVSLRTGLDADKARELYGQDDIKDEILDYRIGCIRGNEAIIKTNRKHLSQIYTSVAIATFLLAILFFYSLLLPTYFDFL